MEKIETSFIKDVGQKVTRAKFKTAGETAYADF